MIKGPLVPNTVGMLNVNGIAHHKVECNNVKNIGGWRVIIYMNMKAIIIREMRIQDGNVQVLQGTRWLRSPQAATHSFNMPPTLPFLAVPLALHRSNENRTQGRNFAPKNVTVIQIASMSV